MGLPFRDWETLYANAAVETLPWYNVQLDADLVAALSRLGIRSGRFLDVGTGPGTQAARLAERGFAVTGSDLSDSAVRQAQRKFPQVRFMVDDITNSMLTKRAFDYIFDRGCFHSLPPGSRQAYLRTVSSLLGDKGFLFLKCFSSRETLVTTTGPYRFSPEEIRTFFRGFIIESITETVYQGTLTPRPKALFCVLQKR